MKLISVSLYGNNPYYCIGAVENARLVSTIYPGWTMRAYVGPEVPRTTTDRLKELLCDVVPMDHGNTVIKINAGRMISKKGMFWKFLAASDQVAEAIIFRDVDSRLNAKEKAAVDEWLTSGKCAHVIRDHNNHCGWPLLGGLWGVRGGKIKNMQGLIDGHPFTGAYGDDLIFLSQKVWPQVRDDVLIHGRGGKPFPPHPPYEGFVGQRVDQHGRKFPD